MLNSARLTFEIKFPELRFPTHPHYLDFGRDTLLRIPCYPNLVSIHMYLELYICY